MSLFLFVWNFITKVSIVFFICVLLSPMSFAQNLVENKNRSYKVQKLTEGFGVIWGMTFISEAEILFTQKKGKVTLLNIHTKTVVDILGVPNVLDNGQGGLLDVALHPEYKKNGLLYFTYVKEHQGQGVVTLSRADLKGNKLFGWQDIFTSQSSSATSRHFGSRITFDEEGHLFFSIGDRGVRSNAQNLSNHAGSILRLNIDGRIPFDTPFVKNKNALDEIYSYGHRNPQGLFYDKKTKRLWSIEHGPRGGDEINVIELGKNYGWPVISYGKEYYSPASVGIGTHKEGMQQPHKVYIPSIAPSSMMVYSGKVFPQWEGNIFAGALVLRHLNRIILDKNAKVLKEERLLEDLKERIRCVIEGPDGLIYISTDSGMILRLMPVNFN